MYKRQYDTCPIVNTSLIQIGRQRYLEIYTANWPKEAASFRVFPGYRPPAYDGEEEILPWDNIDIGVTKAFLLRERHRAYAAQPTKNCREGCSGCGADKLGGERACCPSLKK